MPGVGGNLVPLVTGSVLYLGSAVPLETSVGLEALQAPLRDRYLTADPDQKVTGIDAVLTVFSGGILMQYPGDESSCAWFPMQTLHMCAAVKAVSSSSSSAAFVSVDSPAAQASREPPIFAVIMRRSKGVKVLECHAFVCKSTDAALTFVQSCTHAFQHREGWIDGTPGFGSTTRIVAAESVSGMTDLPRTPLQGFLYSPDQQIGLYNVPAPVVPAIQQPTLGVQPVQYIASNPLLVAVPQVPQGYFANWNQNYGMTYMIVPTSPLYPGGVEQKKKKKKKSKKKKKREEEDEDDDDDEEEELYYVRRSKLNQGQLPPDSVGQGPVRQAPQQITEIHYVPLTGNSPQSIPPQPPAELTTADVYLEKVPPRDVYFYEDQIPMLEAGGGGGAGVGLGYDPYQVQLQDFDYDPSGPQGSGVYVTKLPRTTLEYPYDERGFDTMADRLGYFP